MKRCAPRRSLLAVTALVLALTAPTGLPALAQQAEPVLDYTCRDKPLNSTPGVVRVRGADRYQTAIAISRLRYDDGQGCEFAVASGRNFPDALTAAANLSFGPLLLVPGSSIPAPVRSEISRLDPVWIHTYGGAGVLSPGVMTQLSNYVDGRIIATAGVNRYDTAAKGTFDNTTGSPAFVATGADYPDALAAAGYIRQSQGAFFLVGSDSIPHETQLALGYLRPSRIIVLGGPGAVSARVERGLRNFTTGSVTRIAGADRFETAVRLSERLAPHGSWAVTIVSGRTFADALSAAALGGGPVLLVEPDGIPDVVADELRRLNPQTIFIVGGTGAVSDAVAHDLEQYLSSAN